MLGYLMVMFGGGGGTPSPPKAPETPVKQEEVRRVVQDAGAAKADERKRVPAGKQATMFGGIEKQLKAKLGK
jgi:hypothetical protein